MIIVTVLHTIQFWKPLIESTQKLLRTMEIVFTNAV